MVSVDIQDMFQEKVSNKASGQRFTPQTQRAHSFEDRHRKKIREKKKKVRKPEEEKTLETTSPITTVC